jgi:hypothetical protein
VELKRSFCPLTLVAINCDLVRDPLFVHEHPKIQIDPQPPDRKETPSALLMNKVLTPDARLIAINVDALG